MSELAGEVGLWFHLHREFRSQLGITPMAWLAGARAEVAASLLLQTDRPVGWVGAQVGGPTPTTSVAASVARTGSARPRTGNATPPDADLRRSFGGA